jgi:hypothetical protein
MSAYGARHGRMNETIREVEPQLLIQFSKG